MTLEIVIEQDGPRFRWVLRAVGKDLPNERRLAKGTRWWNTMDEAETDAEEFLSAAPIATIRREPPTEAREP